jgi:phosphorylcholine metabolism protein LicD
LFFLCACLGHRYGKRIPLGKSREDRFWSNTINASEWACYYALFLTDRSMDFADINDDKIVISRMEEYANGGMTILLDEFLGDYLMSNKAEPQLDPGYNKELPKNFLHFIFERAEEMVSGESGT